MCIQAKLSLYLCNFGTEKGLLDVLPLWLVLYLVALFIGDGLQHPHQGLYEVLQVLLPLISCSKSDFREKFANMDFQALHFCIFSPSFIKIVYVVQELKHLFSLFYPKKLSSVILLSTKPCQIKSFGLITIKICQHHLKGRPHTQ